MSRKRILDRLDKILARTLSANAHEADTARRMADELMKQHGITEADLASHTTGFYELSLGAKGWNATWKFALVTAAARYHGCEAIALQHGRRRKVRVVGDKEDVERAVMFFDGLIVMLAELERLTAERLDELESQFDDVDLDCTPRQATDSFRRGVVAAIIEMMAAARPERFGKKARRASSPSDADAPIRKQDLRSSFKGSPPAKDLVVSRKTQSRQEEHKEKIKEKYQPRLQPLRLDQAVSDIWYWVGWQMANEKVCLTDTPVAETVKTASSGKENDTSSTDGATEKPAVDTSGENG